MRGRPMTAIDAQFYWMSAKIPSDQFLLYAFAGVPADLDDAIAAVLDRARMIPDLTIRVAEAGALRYPRWVPCTEPSEDVAAIRAPGDSWDGCLAAAGLLPPPVGDRPPLATNNRPAGGRTLRTLVRQRTELRGPTVTVAVLSAVSTALSEYLDEPCDELGAEVPMAKAGERQAHNHFGNIPVGLYPLLGHDARCERIAADLAGGRLRGQHPASAAADRAFAATPAALLRWGIASFDPDVRPERVTGNTVVSSVHRGAADLRFGAVPVLLTAGFPALSPAMGLTHGVHGIGDTVVVSVHSAESAVRDIEVYLRLLDAAL